MSLSKLDDNVPGRPGTTVVGQEAAGGRHETGPAISTVDSFILQAATKRDARIYVEYKALKQFAEENTSTVLSADELSTEIEEVFFVRALTTLNPPGKGAE